MRSYYEDWREDSGWIDEFAFAEWAYTEGQRDANKMMSHFLANGVSADFALKIVSIGMGTMWYPPRAEMEAAGLLTSPSQSD